MPSWLTWIESLLLGVATVLTLGAGIASYALRTTTLTIAVAPRDGTEQELLRA